MPPAQAQVQVLDFGHLDPDEFEKLCRRLAAELGDVQVGQYGTTGQAQFGIDIFVRHVDGRHTTIQCRRVESVTPGDLHAAVSTFLGGKWAGVSRRFVFATSTSLKPTGVADAANDEAARLSERGITFETWDQEELSVRLKSRPELVDDFWSPEWAEKFCPSVQFDAYKTEAETRAHARASAAEAPAPAPIIVDLGSTTAGIRKAVQRLRDRKPNEIALIAGLIDEADPAEHARRAARMLVEMPAGLRAAAWETWSVVSRVAAKGGEWDAASDAWEQAAEREHEDPAGALVQASIAADLAGNLNRAKTMLARAEEVAPDHPRVELELASRVDDPEERLEALAGLASDDTEVLSLLAAHRTLAYLQLDRIEDAERELEVVRAKHEGDSRILPIIEINVATARARLAMLEGGQIDDAEMVEVESRALALRAELRREKRFTESARLFMTAIDAAVLRYDRTRAIVRLQSLDAEDPELRRDEDRSAILGAAARAGLWEEVLRLLERAPDTAEFRYLRASAALAQDPSGDEAWNALQREVEEEGPEAEQAAMSLLLHSAMRSAKWSDAAEKRLMKTHEKEAVSLRAFYLKRTNRYRDAKRLLKKPRYRDQTWAKRSLFDIAGLQNDGKQIDELVSWILASNPDRNDRLRCARSFQRRRNFLEAERQARLVASDQHGGNRIRAEACWVLMTIFKDAEDSAGEDRWEDASETLMVWISVYPEDPRIGVWLGLVGNRLSQKHAS